MLARPRIIGRVTRLSQLRLLNQTDTGTMVMNSRFGTRIVGEDSDRRCYLQYRDFRSYDSSSSDPFSPDFNNPTDSNGSIAFNITEDFLDMEGRPMLSGENPYVSGSNEGPPHTAASFADWYRTSPTLDPQGNLEIVGELLLGSLGGNVYQFSSNSFFPLDDPALAPLAWPVDPTYGETVFSNHNFGFSTEVHYFFVYQGDEVLSFSGDDDLWVFVDGFLCLDVGGLHPSQSDVMSFADPTAANRPEQDTIVANCKARLTPGDVYEVAIFHAERHTNASNFSLTLDGFVTERSTCDYTCGDGVATRFEFCDDGAGENTGEYGHCLPDCSALGPYCGDGIVDEAFEECDNGDNLGGASGCNPDCTAGPSCGDGIRQPEIGEGCDAGPDNGAPGSACSATCEVIVQ
jgi:fibro-slime domain-containing protein